MTLRYGMPIFLEDYSGKLTGSKFVDLYNRQTICYERIWRASDSTRTTYGVYDFETLSHGPVITLEFGADNSLGKIKVEDSDATPMDEYLPRVSTGSSTSSRSRHFFASDGQQYEWKHRHADDQEWACTNTKGDVISYYSLKLYGEPPYSSSGCMLTVEEDFAHLACEMLATCMIMRHIDAYDL